MALVPYAIDLNVEDPSKIYFEINSEYFRDKFKMIIYNYEDNPSFVSIPLLQCDHLLDQLIECLKDSNDV